MRNEKRILKRTVKNPVCHRVNFPARAGISYHTTHLLVCDRTLESLPHHLYSSYLGNTFREYPSTCKHDFLIRRFFVRQTSLLLRNRGPCDHPTLLISLEAFLLRGVGHGQVLARRGPGLLIPQHSPWVKWPLPRARQGSRRDLVPGDSDG